MAAENASEGSDDLKKTEELLREVLRANNRTNHAVRAIVLPSTRLLAGFLIALPLFGLGLLMGSDGGFLFFISALVLVAAAIWAIVDQLRETKLSEIPDNARKGPYRSSNWRR